VRPEREFDEFYQACYGRVVAMLTAILGDRAAAEDAAQEAFARALARWRRVAGYEVPEAWVRRVALRLAVDHGRRARRALRLTGQLSGRPGAIVPDPGDALIYSPVGAALARLPRAEREVLILHCVAGMPVAVIAAERRLTARAVKSRLAAARRHLERELAGPVRREGARDDG
jgi:RNA polymerase sigma-70 factor (ECF subfamily)